MTQEIVNKMNIKALAEHLKNLSARVDKLEARVAAQERQTTMQSNNILQLTKESTKAKLQTIGTGPTAA